MMDKASDAVNRDLDVRDLYSRGRLPASAGLSRRVPRPASTAAWRSMTVLTARPTGERERYSSADRDAARRFSGRRYVEAVQRGLPRKSNGRCCATSPTDPWPMAEPRHCRLTIHDSHQQRQRPTCISDGVEGTAVPASRRIPYLLPPESDAAEAGAICRNPYMTQALSAARMIRTTNGTIAFANLAKSTDRQPRKLPCRPGAADQPFMGRAGRSPNHAPHVLGPNRRL